MASRSTLPFSSGKTPPKGIDFHHVRYSTERGWDAIALLVLFSLRTLFCTRAHDLGSFPSIHCRSPPQALYPITDVQLSVIGQAMSLPLSGAALAVAALSSSVAAYNVFRQLRIGKPKDWFYEDVDGYATPKALAEFSCRGIKVAVLLFSAIGTGTSIAGLVLSTVYKFRHGFLLENGLNAAAWVSMIVS